VRSRIGIPGGTCEFDLPAYYAWQQRPSARRRADLLGWVATLEPLAQALQLLLQLVREAGAPHKVVSSGGQFQQGLPGGRSYQLLRVRIDDAEGLVPEMTGHRLQVSVRLMRADADGRLRLAPVDMPFELTLCT
jgi:cell division protein ZapD